jgi:hypothetical protein
MLPELQQRRAAGVTPRMGSHAEKAMTTKRANIHDSQTVQRPLQGVVIFIRVTSHTRWQGPSPSIPCARTAN